MKVTAKATRDGNWWAVEIPEVEGGFTQTERLDQIPAQVAEVVFLLEGVAMDDVEVTVIYDRDDPTAIAENGS